MKLVYCSALILLNVLTVLAEGILFPKESETREVKELNGVWNFRLGDETDPDAGFREKWYTKPLQQTGKVIPMPVPSSYNDVTQNKAVRDYVGWVWYDTEFYSPRSWSKGVRVLLRFGSVHYIARVYLNGVSVVNHTSGHLPFQVDVTGVLKYSKANRLTVAVNNTLTPETVPQGSLSFNTDDPQRYPKGYYVQSVNFDFFNYAGIHRSVTLYAMPQVYIDDITVMTDIKGSTGIINYTVSWSNVKHQVTNAVCYIEVYDKGKNLVGQGKNCQGTVIIHKANFWWPYGMHPQPGYLYVLKVQLQTPSSHDIYYQNVGIRTVEVTNTSFLINKKPFYFMGFGMHEDSNIRGKGLDLPLIIKNFNLIKWFGANSFRTSHYPYAEEIMDQADAQGIAVIGESTAVGLSSFDSTLLNQHLQVMKELVQRDKNRPSVVMWSVANEPQSNKPESESYFKTVVEFTRSLDSTRPISAALSVDYRTDKIGKFMDIIMANRYFGWYSNPGYTDQITQQVVNEYDNIYNEYKKLVMISEYGADTIPGLHMDPPFIFTEDYQTDVMMQYHKAFNILREKGFFMGEHIWNFADFLTYQQLTRVVGNKKGMLTRERQPKASARVLRCRYHKLANMTISDNGVYCPFA